MASPASGPGTPIKINDKILPPEKPRPIGINPPKIRVKPRMPGIGRGGGGTIQQFPGPQPYLPIKQTTAVNTVYKTY